MYCKPGIDCGACPYKEDQKCYDDLMDDAIALLQAHKEADVKQNNCDFCANHESGDTLYESSSLDGGVGYDYIRNIKFCPLCGSKLKGGAE